MSSSTFNSDDDKASFERSDHPFRFPYGLLVALVSIVAIELMALNLPVPFDRNAIFIPDDRSPNLVETIVDAKLNLSNEPGPQYDILVLGDSSGLMGVDPRQLSEIVDKPVLNLCTVSLMGVEAHQLYLKRFVETHGAPSLIIYHYAPGELHYTNEDLIDWGYRIGVQQWLADVYGLPIPQEDVDRTFSSEIPPKNSEHDQFEPLPSQKFREVSQRLLSVISSRARYRSKARGPWPSHDEVSDIIIRQKGFLQEVKLSDRIEPMNMKLGTSLHYQEKLSELIEEYGSQGIKVFMVANPLPEFMKTDLTLKNLRIQENLLRAIARKHDSAELLFAEQRFFANDNFATLTHLRPNAAITNTSQIGEELLKLQE